MDQVRCIAKHQGGHFEDTDLIPTPDGRIVGDAVEPSASSHGIFLEELCAQHSGSVRKFVAQRLIVG